MIQLFVVAGAYGFALFENWETQICGWLVFHVKRGGLLEFI